VDLFGLVMALIGVAFLVAIVLLGVFHPRSGAQVLDWRPTRSPELEVQNEIDDAEQMREAINARRRARGQAELSEQELEQRLAADQRERERLRTREPGA